MSQVYSVFEVEKMLQELAKKDIEIMEGVSLDLFGKQQCRWRMTKLTKKYNEVLERNSKILFMRVKELRRMYDIKEEQR